MPDKSKPILAAKRFGVENICLSFAVERRELAVFDNRARGLNFGCMNPRIKKSAASSREIQIPPQYAPERLSRITHKATPRTTDSCTILGYSMRFILLIY